MMVSYENAWRAYLGRVSRESGRLWLRFHDAPLGVGLAPLFAAVHESARHKAA
jgi:hypothetical protein